MARFESGVEFAAAMDQVVAGLNNVAAITSRLATANVSMGMVVSDLPGAEYRMSFKDGAVTGDAVGAMAASITVTATQDVLDKMFSGKLSGESAYLGGQLRLRGDEWIAEGLAGYVPYMVPLYKAATGQ